MKKFILSSICLLSIYAYTYAQRKGILNDSLTNQYGTYTTHYWLEKDIIEEREQTRNLDSLLNGFHVYMPTQKLNNLYQDMGVMGTAMRPIFYTPNQQLGLRAGIDSYMPFLKTSENIRLYDTKSPFTYAHYVQSFRGDQSINFIFTRNINQQWNLGFDYTRFNTDKQFASRRTPDVLSDVHILTAHVRYFSKNKRYKLIYYYSHLNNAVEELGGVRLKTNDTRDSVYGFQLEEANLTEARSWQTQNIQHLYQQFRAAKGFQLYHIFDYQRQRDVYSDASFAENNRAFYKKNLATDSLFYFNQNRTDEGTVTLIYQNQVGIKGWIANRIFYQGYIKNRIVEHFNTRQGEFLQSYLYDAPTQTFSLRDSITLNKLQINNFELIAGGTLFYQFRDSVSRLQAEAEYLVGKEDFRLKAFFESKNLQIRFLSLLVQPTLAQRQWVSNHTYWFNNLENTFTQELEIGFALRAQKGYIKPFANYQLVNNYIYFDTLARPKQTKEVLQMLRVGVEWQWQWRRFRLENLWIYSQQLGADLFRMPPIFINSRIVCENCLFSKRMRTQIGFDLHYKSDYFADAYMPVTKQFFLQNSWEVQGYLVADFFLNILFGDKARFFIKYGHVNSVAGKGYITTPVYPGMRGTVAFGFSWMFFN